MIFKIKKICLTYVVTKTINTPSGVHARLMNRVNDLKDPAEA